jgi:hypothetical protein
MRKGLATSALLGVSALLGLAMLGTDHNLWSYEPSHAYGLIAFVAIDVVGIILILWKGSRTMLRLGGAWGALFALIMVSDIFSGGAAAFGLDSSQFAVYLFGLGNYDNQHIAFLFPALFAVNILAAIVGFVESRATKTA